MIAAWKSLSTWACDAVLGWGPILPRDLALCLLAAGAAYLLVSLRRWAADQPLLRQTVEDRRRLAELIRTARREQDRSPLPRYRRTRVLVAGVRLAEEFKPAALSVVPLAMVVTWMAARFEYLPPIGGGPLRIEACGPVSSVGDVIHLVPTGGVEAKEGWVRLVQPGDRGGRPVGLAAWTLRVRSRRQPYRLTFRCGDRSIEHWLAVGNAWYHPPARRHGNQWTTRVRLTEYRPFGLASPIPAIGAPAWLLAYLLLAIVCFCLFKRLRRIA